MGREVKGEGQARQARQASEERARRAVTLYLHGRRVTEIAAELGVGETTVRRWTRDATRLALAEEERAARATQLGRAIESQRAVASAAWEAYERERQLDEALLRGELDRVRRRSIRGARRRGQAEREVGDDSLASLAPPEATEATEAMEEYERPARGAQGARYLGLALAAQREVARLQGLYTRLEATDGDARITISRRPDGPENTPEAEARHGEAPDGQGA